MFVNIGRQKSVYFIYFFGIKDSQPNLLFLLFQSEIIRNGVLVWSPTVFIILLCCRRVDTMDALIHYRVGQLSTEHHYLCIKLAKWDLGVFVLYRRKGVMHFHVDNCITYYRFYQFEWNMKISHQFLTVILIRHITINQI